MIHGPISNCTVALTHRLHARLEHSYQDAEGGSGHEDGRASDGEDAEDSYASEAARAYQEEVCGVVWLQV